MGDPQSSIDFCLAEIKNIYGSASPEKQSLIIGKLELVVEEINRSHSLSTTFDHVRARKIREEAGLSKRELVGKLGLNGSKTAYILITDYEKGARIGTPKKNENSQRYLSWLKEQGYNPYNI